MEDNFHSQMREALFRACDGGHLGTITSGRSVILAMPRERVNEDIERVAARCLDLGDAWHYRRLMELYEMLDAGLLRKLLASGLVSENAEIRETAEDFSRNDDAA